MREIDIERTAYPQTPLNITDKEIIQRYTLLPDELSLVKSYRGDKLSLAVRLKVFGHLLSHNFRLSEIPPEVVDYIASQLQVSREDRGVIYERAMRGGYVWLSELTNLLSGDKPTSHTTPSSEKPSVTGQSEIISESKDSRSEQIKLIREYAGFSPFTKEEYGKLEAWLIGQAEKQFHLVDLVNEAIFHLIEIKVELPSFQRLLRLAAHALQQSDISQKELLNQSLNFELKGKLDALLQSECQ